MSDLTKPEYNDVDIDFDYIIVKTKESTIENNGGDVYEAARKAWTLSLDNIKKRNINYVLVAVNGVVREVYEVDAWKKASPDIDGYEHKVEFDGHVAPDDIRNKVIDKTIPSVYRQQGMASSSLYKTQD